MKKSILILFTLLSAISFGHNIEFTADSLLIDSNLASNTQPDDSFYMAGLATMTIIFMIAFIGLLIVGLVLACILLAIFVGLVMIGILSTSVVVGLHKKSFQKGFKLGIVLTSIFLSSLLVTLFFVIINKIMHWFIFEVAIVGGLLSGAVVGLVIGLIFFRLLTLAIDKLRNRMKDRQVMAAGNSAQPPAG